MNTYQRELTDRQKKFCDMVLGGMNDTRAALQAGYSRSTAYSGWLMTLPLVRKYLQEHQSGQSAGEVKIAADRVLAELCKIAFANVVDCFNTDGSVRRFDDVDPDTMAGVESITITERGAVKIKMHSKIAALEKIARRINFYSAVETPQTVAAGEVIPGEHPDFVDDMFDHDNVVREIEDCVAGITGDDDDDEEIVMTYNRGQKADDQDADDGEVRAEDNSTNTWLKKRYAKELEEIKLKRKADALAESEKQEVLAGSAKQENTLMADDKERHDTDDAGGRVIPLNGQQDLDAAANG